MSHSQEAEDENQTDIREFIISYRAFHNLMIELDESAYFKTQLNVKHDIIETDLFDFLGELAYRRGEHTEELKQKEEIDQQLKNVEDESIDDSGDENLRDNENINKLSEDAELKENQLLPASKLVEVAVNSNNNKINSQDLHFVMNTSLNDDEQKVNENVAALDALLSVVMEDSLYQNMEQNI